MYDQDGRDLDDFSEDVREEFRVKSVYKRVHEESHTRHRQPNQDFQGIKGATSAKPSVEPTPAAMSRPYKQPGRHVMPIPQRTNCNHL